MELLFESRLEHGQIRGKMRSVQGRAKVADEPVLEGSNAGDGAGASIYGSVLRDGGRYRMWYQGWPRDWTGGNSCLVCYAESDDGIVWQKPALNLDDRFAEPHNLTNLGLHAPSVFIDPAGPSSHRYRATGHAGPKQAGAAKGIATAGYYTAHSADGLTWHLDGAEPTWPRGDVITSIYHPQQQRALVALKYNVRMLGIPRRSIWNAELRDGAWSDPWCALVPDPFDDTAAMARGLASGDYYGMAMQPAGGGTVGFIWQFRHSLPRTVRNDEPGPGVFGVVDVSLAYQPNERDAWLHAPGRQDFIRHDDPSWGMGCIYTASSPVEVDGEHRLYMCCTYPHGWYVDPRWQTIDEAKNKLIERGFSRIGYAHWPKWRLFGYRAEPKGTIDINLGEITEPCELRLNYETHNADGYVRAAVKDQDGLTLDACQRLTGNEIAAPVTWANGSRIAPSPGKPTVVTIELNESTLWAYELQTL